MKIYPQMLGGRHVLTKVYKRGSGGVVPEVAVAAFTAVVVVVVVVGVVVVVAVAVVVVVGSGSNSRRRAARGCEALVHKVNTAVLVCQACFATGAASERAWAARKVKLAFKPLGVTRIAHSSGALWLTVPCGSCGGGRRRCLHSACDARDQLGIIVHNKPPICR